MTQQKKQILTVLLIIGLVAAVLVGVARIATENAKRIIMPLE